MSYDLKDQAPIWRNVEGLYIGEVTALREGKYLIDKAQFYNPNMPLFGDPYAHPAQDFVNFTVSGSRAIISQTILMGPADEEFCSIPIPEGMLNTFPGVGSACGEFGGVEVSTTSLTSTFNKDGSAVSLPTPAFQGESSQVTAVDDHTWYASIRMEAMFISISANCVDEECQHYTVDIDYFSIDQASGTTSLILTVKSSYDRVESVEEWKMALQNAMDEKQIEPTTQASVKKVLNGEYTCMTAIGYVPGSSLAPNDMCVPESEWCEYDPNCVSINPYAEPDSSLRPSLLAAIFIVAAAILVSIVYTWFRRRMKAQEARYKHHFARRIAETIRIDGTTMMNQGMTPEVLAEEFEKIDVSKDGLVSREELWEFLQTGKVGDIAKDDFDALFEAVDADGNGNVDFLEFCAFLGKIDDQVQEMHFDHHHKMNSEERKSMRMQTAKALINRADDDNMGYSSRRQNEEKELMSPILHKDRDKDNDDGRLPMTFDKSTDV